MASDKEKMTTDQELFLEILHHAVHKDLPELNKEEIRQNLGRVLHLSAIHKVMPLVVDALYHVFPDMMKRYTESASEQAIDQAALTGSFILLYRKMQDAGLNPLVMKGIICRSLYKEPELRPSVDEDLLISPQEIQQYHSFLLKEGFLPVDPGASLETSAEISYKHPGSGLYLEVHKYLFPPSDEKYGTLSTLFEKPEDLVIIRIYSTDIRTLGCTDHFLYLICHAYKHVIYSGIGIRQLCDITLFAEHYGQHIDWSTVFSKCGQLHLDLFLRAVLKICAEHLGMDEEKAGYRSVFTVQETDEIPLLLDILSGGIYGAQDENRLHSANMTLSAVSDKNNGRGNKWLSRSLFPPLSYMAHSYPYLEKHSFLLPVAWGQRIFTYLSSSRKAARPSRTVEIGKQRIELLKKYNLL